MFWDFGSLHQGPRVGGTQGCVHCDESDGWQSPVPQGDNTGGRECLPLLPTIALRSRRQVVYILMLCGVDCVRDGRSRTS